MLRGNCISWDLPSAKVNKRLDNFSMSIATEILASKFLGQCIGIFGGYGTGKTSVMMRIQEIVAKGNVNPPLTLWFRAWRYEHLPTVTEALAKVLLKSLDGHQDFRWVEDMLKSLSISFQGLQIKADLHGKDREENATSRDLSTFESHWGPHESEVDSAGKRILVLIDDLDRCSPQKAFQLLDHLKCLFEVRGFLFLVGLNPGMLSERNEEQYSKASGFSIQEYLSKIFQFGIQLHEPSNSELQETYWSASNIKDELTLSSDFDTFLKVCPRNFRTVRKIANTFQFLLPLLKTADEKKLCLGLLLLRHISPKWYGEFLENPVGFHATASSGKLVPEKGNNEARQQEAGVFMSSFSTLWLKNEYQHYPPIVIESVKAAIGGGVF